mmetsp:Transcript_14482/g.30932  ORF Transcript_14482/g.30932 Transcript_14482/m.30932 type:complete len:299 (-) Transcript_14482:446-1342(-)
MAGFHVFLVACGVWSSATHVLAFGNLPPPMTSFPIHNHIHHNNHMSSTAIMSQARTTSTTTENEKQQPFSLAYPLTQVVSDIDDTLKSSGGVQVAGVTLGGVDVQYDRGDFYPGVFQFMWELSSYSVTLNQRYAEFRAEKAGMKNESLDTRMSPPKVAVLTARAEEFKAALEIKDESKLAVAFRKTGEASKINPTKDWGVGPVLYGSVSEWIIQYKKGLRKFNNFERLLEQDPTGQIMQVSACVYFTHIVLVCGAMVIWLFLFILTLNENLILVDDPIPVVCIRHAPNIILSQCKNSC